MAETFDYTEAKATADELIAEFGQSATLRRETHTSVNPWDSDVTTVTDHPCTIAVVDYSTFEINQGRVLATDKKVIMAVGNLTVTPTPEDRLVIGGVLHTIVGPDSGNGVKVTAPAGIPVLYELQARK